VVFVIIGARQSNWLAAFEFVIAICVGLVRARACARVAVRTVCSHARGRRTQLPELLPLIVNTNLATGSIKLSRAKVRPCARVR
jgi:hypothetical protein